MAAIESYIREIFMKPMENGHRNVTYIIHTPDSIESEEIIRQYCIQKRLKPELHSTIIRDPVTDLRVGVVIVKIAEEKSGLIRAKAEELTKNITTHSYEEFIK